MKKWILSLFSIIVLCVIAAFICSSNETINQKIDGVFSSFGNGNEKSLLNSLEVESKTIDNDTKESTLNSDEETTNPNVNNTENIYKYDFNKLEDLPDSVPNQHGSYELVFEPVGVCNGWLYELSGGQKVSVVIGTLVGDGGNFNERYIDITGVNGNVRYLLNSWSRENYGSRSQFWSAKQQVGNSIVKDFSKDYINAVELFECEDGTKYIVGYDAYRTNYNWSYGVPETNYFVFESENEIGNDETKIENPNEKDNIIKYPFDSYIDERETPDLIFEPVGVNEGWLYELSGGQEIKVYIGHIYADNGIGEQYIDITGVNGHVRFLHNSSSLLDNGYKKQYWSAKQLEGNAIVKDFSKDYINAVAFFELNDGTKCILGYDALSNDFWFLGVPESNCFILKK